MKIFACVIFTAIYFRSDKTFRLCFHDVAKHVMHKQLYRCVSPLSGTLLYFIQFLVSTVIKRKTRSSVTRVSSKARLESWKTLLTWNTTKYNVDPSSKINKFYGWIKFLFVEINQVLAYLRKKAKWKYKSQYELR